MPSRWQIVLPGVDASLVRVEQLHAMTSGWFDDTADAHQARAKPYSITPPRPAGDTTTFNVGLVDDSMVDRLLTRTAPGVRLRLGGQHTRTVQAPTQVAGLSWSTLDATPADSWCVNFATPTTFRRGNNFTPWPAPKAVLGSLRATWRHFAPASAGALDLDLATDPVWVTDIDGANEVVKVNDRTVSGFVGRIRFTCDAPAHVAASIDRLIQLAPYSGVGAHTTRGFGVTRPEPTWRQRRTG